MEKLKVIPGGKRTFEVVLRPSKGTADIKKPPVQPKPDGRKLARCR